MTKILKNIDIDDIGVQKSIADIKKASNQLNESQTNNTNNRINTDNH